MVINNEVSSYPHVVAEPSSNNTAHTQEPADINNMNLSQLRTLVQLLSQVSVGQQSNGERRKELKFPYSRANLSDAEREYRKQSSHVPQQLLSDYDRHYRAINSSSTAQNEARAEHFVLFLMDQGWETVSRYCPQPHHLEFNDEIDKYSALITFLKRQSAPTSAFELVKAFLQISHFSRSSSQSLSLMIDQMNQLALNLPKEMNPFMIDITNQSPEQIKQQSLKIWERMFVSLCCQATGNRQIVTEILTTMSPDDLSFMGLKSKARQMEAREDAQQTLAGQVHLLHAGSDRAVALPTVTEVAMPAVKSALKQRDRFFRSKHDGKRNGSQYTRKFKYSKSTAALLSALLSENDEKLDSAPEKCKLILLSIPKLFRKPIAILDSGASTSTVSMSWIKLFSDCVACFSPAAATPMTGLAGQVHVVATCYIKIGDKNIKFQVVNNSDIPPLVSFADLQPFTLSSAGEMTLTNSTISWRKDIETSLMTTPIIPTDTQNVSLLSAKLQVLVDRIHQEANHAPVSSMRRILSTIPKRILHREELFNVIRECNSCQLQKDNRNRAFSHDIREKNNSQGHMDILVLPQSAERHIGILIGRIKRRGPVFAINIKGKTETDLKAAMNSVFQGTELPPSMKVDGESGITVHTISEFLQKGMAIQKEQSTNVNGNPCGENTIKIFLKSQQHQKIKPVTVEILDMDIVENIQLDDDGKIKTELKHNISKGTNFPQAYVVVTAATTSESNTTHQKIQIRKLDENEKREAMRAFELEMAKFKEYGVYSSVKRTDVPRGAPIVKPVVVYTRKLLPDGSRKFKCRVTANGSSLKMEKNETTTSNTDLSELRLLLSIAALHPEYAGDVLTADAEQGYLQTKTPTTKPIYMFPPAEHQDYDSNVVWKLEKNLYGTPNGGAIFEQEVKTILLELGWQALPGCKHAWRLDRGGKLAGYLAVYVDDFIAIGVTNNAERLLNEIGKKLRINIASPKTSPSFVGNQFTKAGDFFLQHQTEYVKGFPMTQRNHSTPLPIRFNEKKVPSPPLSMMEIKEFQKLLGRLQYVSRDSRPDISFAASFMATAGNAPTISPHVLCVDTNK